MHERLAEIEWQEEGERRNRLPSSGLKVTSHSGVRSHSSARSKGKWVSGVFDRVVIEKDAKRVVVYDFKTGSAKGAEAQLGLYKKVLEKMLPTYQIDTRIEKISL